MDAIEIVKAKLPFVKDWVQLMTIAEILLDNPSFAQAIIDNSHKITASDLVHDLNGLKSKDEHFVPRIS